MRVERYVNTAFDVIFTLIHKQLLMHNELYSECSLFTIVNWFFFLALDEGGSSSNIFFYQLVKSYVAKVHTS